MPQNLGRKGAAASVLVGQIPYLRRYARGLTRNPADADDLVQGCLVRALANLHRFQMDTNVRAWLLTILHNLFIDGVRKTQRMRDAFIAADLARGGLLQPPNQVHHIQLTELGNALSKLPPEQQFTLSLVVLDDMTYEEAASITGVPVGTIRSRLSRARQALLMALDGLDGGNLEAGAAASRSPAVAVVSRPVSLRAARPRRKRRHDSDRLRKLAAA